jgi:hypothetical protein
LINREEFSIEEARKRAEGVPQETEEAARKL